MSAPGYRTAIVTGASSGIGEAVCRMLAGRGVTVHALARRADRLERLAAETRAIPHVVDVTDIVALTAEIEAIEADILVNNAGTTFNGKFDTFPPEKIDQLLDLNVRAMMHLTRLVLPGMRSRKRGHIFLTGSCAGIWPMAGSAPYAASKAAVSQFLNILRLDTLGTAIRWTELVPGRVETEIFGLALGDAAAARKLFLDGKDALQPEDIAASIEFALSLPAQATIARIEIYPTRQAVGGFAYAD